MNGAAPDITVYDEDTELTLKAKWELCDRCDGKGTHVNPAIDGNGISPDDPDLDEDFWDMYRSGGYDVACEECGGRGMVAVLDEDRATPEQISAYHRHLQDQADYRAEVMAERRMGA